MRNLLKARINLNLLKHNLKTQRAYIVLFTVFFFVLFPSSTIVKILRRDGYPSMLSGDSVPFALIIFTGMVMFFMPFITQSYLNSKKAVDVYHALPITRNDLYLTNAFSSFIIVYLPFTINYVLGYSLLASQGVNFANHHVFLYFAFASILFFAIQTCNNFVIMNTGTLANGLVHAFILFIAPFVAYGAFTSFVESFIFGVSAFDEMILSYLSPSYGLLRLIGVPSKNQVLVVGTVWLIVSIGFTCFNLNLYNKRKSERSEEPFTNHRYFPLVVSLFTGLVLTGLMSLFTYSNDSSSNKGLADYLTLNTFLIPMGISFVMYIVLDFFRYKSTKHFAKAVIHYFIIAATTVSICVVLIFTNLLGYGNFIPSTQSIREVKVTHYSVVSQLYPTSYYYDISNLVLTEDQSIQEIVNFHHKILDFYEENPNFGYYDSDYTFENENAQKAPVSNIDTISIEYKVRGGFTVSRNYNIPSSLSTSLYTLANNWDVQTSAHRILNPEVVLDTNSVTFFNATMTKTRTLSFTENVRTEFINRYKEDLSSMDDETFAFEESELKYVLQYSAYTYDAQRDIYASSNVSTLFIDSRFKYTVDYLDSLIGGEETMNPSGSSFTLATFGENDIVIPQYGLPFITIDDLYGYAILDSRSLTRDEAHALSSNINGPHLRTTSKAVYVVTVGSSTYFLPTDFTTTSTIDN